MKIRQVSDKLLFVFLVLFFSAVSRTTDIYITNNFSLLKSRAFLGKWAYITIVHNTGAAFGILPWANKFLAFFTAIVLLIIFVYMLAFVRKNTLPGILFFSLICAGALGNLCQRLFQGYILDYIDLKVWPVFNLNDTFITLGSAGLFFLVLKKDAGKNIHNNKKPEQYKAG